MPKQYEAIRDALVKDGKGYDQAQAEAAAIYNHRHPGHPMHPDHAKLMRDRLVKALKD